MCIIIGLPAGGPILIFGGSGMIRNLNPITFRDYGTVLPERREREKDGSECNIRQLRVEGEEAVVYRAASETLLSLGSGMSVLSVSLDGVSFQNFYLDKSVSVRPGILFALTPFIKEAIVAISADTVPIPVSVRPLASLRVDHQLRVEGIYTFYYQEREQGFMFPGESHPFPELTYVDQGELHSVADGQDILLKQGDVAVFGPNQWHMHYADIGVAPGYVTITFDLEGVDITPLLNRKFAAPQQAVALIQQMLREQERMDDYSNDMIIAQLSQLVLTLLREAASPKAAKLQTANAIHSENEIIRQAQIYISSHIREKLSVPLVARQVDVSPSYLTALFHKNLQISPGEYIRRIKLQESKQMIRENELNFTEIAAALQYSTVHHFSRQFKEKFGITPTEYAKSVR